MKVVKEGSFYAKKIRKIEEFLCREKVSISHRSDGLIISVEHNGSEETFVIRDPESQTIESVFPSQFEPTRIQHIDSYVCIG